MRAPLRWIREYVDLPADVTAEALAHELTALGLKLEALHGGDVSGPLVVGRVLPQADGRVKIEADLVNVLTGVHLDAPSSTAQADNLRMAAHRIADALHFKILGVKGAFATRIAYISVDGRPPNQKFELYVADSDGANRRRLGP